MSYDSKSYRGTLEGVRPPSRDPDIPASPGTTDSFLSIIQSLRPESAADSASFSRVLQHHNRPIVIELLPDEAEYRPYGLGQPLGLAAAHDITRRRRLLWKKGLAPGLYDVTETVFAEQTGSPARTDLQVNIRENVRSVLTLGRAVDTASTRPAHEEEVVQAIDMIFLAAAGVTAAYTPLSSPDNPMVVPSTPY